MHIESIRFTATACLFLALMMIGTARGEDYRPPPFAVNMVSPQTYRVIDGQSLKLEIFEPTRDATMRARPVVLGIGARWSEHERSGIPAEARILASHGFAVVLPDYRDGPGAVFPAALQDIAAARAWCLENAGRHALDPSRMGVFGAGRGGLLAMLFVLAKHDPELARIAGLDAGKLEIRSICTWFTPTDLVAASTEPGMSSEYLTKSVTEWMGGPYESKKELHRLASPIHHLAGAPPPMLLFHGDKDTLVPFAHAERMARKVLESGGKVELVRVKGGDYWFRKVDEKVVPEFREIWLAMTAFFKDTLLR